MLYAQNGVTDAKIRHNEQGHLNLEKRGLRGKFGPPDLGFGTETEALAGASPEEGAGRRRGGRRRPIRPDPAGSGRGDGGEAREGGGDGRPRRGL